jgi:nitrogen-specific signal transduction histidine kinase
MALLIDALIHAVPDFIQDKIISGPGIALYILISASYVTGQYFILQYVKKKTREIRSKSSLLNTTHKVVTAVQYGLVAILVFVILELLIAKQYHLFTLIAATVISYSLNVILLILFAERLLKWYRSNRNSVVILLYSMCAAALAFSSSVALVADFRNLIIKEQVITPVSPIIFPSFDPGTIASYLSSIYRHSNMIATLLVWSTTVLLLYHYFHTLSKSARVKFWVLITLPLIYYLSSILLNFNLYTPQTDSEAFYYYAFLSLNATAAGILFGLAFRTVAKSIRPNSAVRDYIAISAYGFVLLFIANQATLTPTPYPPFALAAVSTMGLAAYLIYIGIYSAGISMSEDINLRQTIRKSAIEESKLLVSIGSAQIHQQLEKKVLQYAKDRAEKMADQTGVQLSLTEADMKYYLNSVLKEIKVIQDVDKIVRKGKGILETSLDFMACLRFSGLQLAYNNYFDVYEEIMDKYRKGNHDGIRLVTSIDKNSVEIVREFLAIGVEIRHVRNLPPIDFAVSDKEMTATIEKSESGGPIQNLLVSNEPAYVDHFVSIFEELWKNGIGAQTRINAIEEGVDSEGIDILQNPAEIKKVHRDLIKSANHEILMIFSTIGSANSEEQKKQIIETIELLKEGVGRGVEIRILTPKDEFLDKSLSNLTGSRTEKQIGLEHKTVHLRYIETDLQARVSVLVVDKIFCLAIEIKDDPKYRTSSGGIGLATFSNSKATVLSYVSIFETLWKQTEMYEALKIHDKMQKEFINIAAHELRNPIQPLVLSSESLKGSMPNEERVSIMIRNAKKLQALANEILDITKIESNTLILNKEKVNVNEVIVYSIKDFFNHQTIAEGKVNLVFEPTGEDIFVEADRDRLGQVVSNLINNSIKFTEEGTISISARKSADQKEVTISVKDTGSGIDPEIMPRLFSKFATKSDVGGTGLGLFICKSIIEAHEGKIWADNNKPGKGATFTFSLPTSPPPVSLPFSATYSTLPPSQN